MTGKQFRHSIRYKILVAVAVPLAVLFVVTLGVEIWKSYKTRSMANAYMGYIRELAFMSAFDSLKKGNMSQFREMLREYATFEKVKEFSLLSPEGEILYSSAEDKISQKDASVQAGVTDDYTVKADGATTYYHPMQTVAYCIRCHTTWPEGSINSVYKISIDDSELRSLTVMLYLSMGIMIAIILAVSFIILMAVKRLIFQRMDETCSVFVDLTSGEGDLTRTIAVTKNDEIATMVEHINTFIRQLRHSMAELKQKIDMVTGSVSHIDGSLQRINSGVDQNFDDLNALVGAVEQVNATMTATHKTFEQMNSELASRVDSIEESAQSMGMIVEAVHSVSRTINSVSSDMDRMEETSRKINEIMSIINDIAEQTNLLSLNASIEAARAGEAGRGFAVVADEIRKLAVKTKDSTGSINDILSNDRMLKSQIITSIRRNSEQSAEVQSAAEQMSRFTSEVSQFMRSLSVDLKSLNGSVEDGWLALSKSMLIFENVREKVADTKRESDTIRGVAAHLAEGSTAMKSVADKFKV